MKNNNNTAENGVIQNLPAQPKLAIHVEEKVNVEKVIKRDDSFEKMAEKCLESVPVDNIKEQLDGRVDEDLLNHIKKKSYLYQEKSVRKGDGLKTLPYSDMVNKELLFKIIDEMEKGNNLFELDNLLKTSIKQYKLNFRDQVTKYHQDIKDKLKKDIDKRHESFYEKEEPSQNSSPRHINIGKQKKLNTRRKNLYQTFSLK